MCCFLWLYITHSSCMPCLHDANIAIQVKVLPFSARKPGIAAIIQKTRSSYFIKLPIRC